jgi:hypothetical protein
MEIRGIGGSDVDVRAGDVKRSGWTRGRRWSIGFNVALAVVSLSALVVMVNFLAVRHPLRTQWGRDARLQISAVTRELLLSLTNDVQVTVFFNPDEPLFSSVTGLLREYQLASARIKVQVVDYTRYPDEALVVKTRYQLPAGEERDLVIFAAAGGVRTVSAGELSDYDLSAVLAGTSREVKRTHFKGEPLFTSAIVAVSDPQSPRAYYLEDHGEHPLDSAGEYGYGRLQEVLRNQKVTLESFRFRGTNDLPADCQLLVVAGPRNRFSAEELARLEGYLNRGGRLFLLFNYLTLTNQTGLEPLLAKWGVEVGRGVIVDPENSTTSQNVLSTRIGTHPIVRPLVLDQMPVDVLLPRALQPLKMGAGDAPRVEPLAMSGDRSKLVTEWQGGLLRSTPRDPIGSFPFLVAIEKGSIPGVASERSSTRIVVAGDSFFLSNTWINRKANASFAGYAVNWLLDRSLLVGGIKPHAIRSYSISVTQRELVQARWLLLGLLPGSVLALGLLVWLRRRR